MPKKTGSSESVDSKDEDHYSKCQGDGACRLKASGVEGSTGTKRITGKYPPSTLPLATLQSSSQQQRRHPSLSPLTLPYSLLSQSPPRNQEF